MGNDQLLPAYNVKVAICDKYIAVIDVKKFASDMECFVQLMEKFKKFTMFENETKDKKYYDNLYRTMNFFRDENGNLICLNWKKFIFKYEKKV